MLSGAYHLPIAGLLFLLLSACAAQGPSHAELSSATVDLLDGSVLGPKASAPLPEVDLLAVNDDMRAFLRRHVPAGLGDRRKVELILQAVLKDGLKLNYNTIIRDGS